MAFKDDFTPEEGTSTYTMQNLESGDSLKLRVMTEMLTGYSLWAEENGDKTVIRAEEKEEIDVSKAAFNKLTNSKNRVKQFIGCIVYNYHTEQFEVLETDKGSIIGKLWTMDQDPDLGDLRKYDIKLSKTGQGKDTRYDVLSLGVSDVDSEIKKEFDKLEFNLENLFNNGNPLIVDDINN